MHLACVLALVLSWALSGSRYGWLQQMDAGVAAGDFEDGSGNSRMLVWLLVGAVLAVEAVLIAKTRAGVQRIVPAVVIVMALGVALLGVLR